MLQSSERNTCDTGMQDFFFLCNLKSDVWMFNYKLLTHTPTFHNYGPQPNCSDISFLNADWGQHTGVQLQTTTASTEKAQPRARSVCSYLSLGIYHLEPEPNKRKEATSLFYRKGLGHASVIQVPLSANIGLVPQHCPHSSGTRVTLSSMFSHWLLHLCFGGSINCLHNDQNKHLLAVLECTSSSTYRSMFNQYNRFCLQKSCKKVSGV